MPDSFVSHLTWIREWWAVIAGASLALYWAGIRVLKTVFITQGQFVSYQQFNSESLSKIEKKVDKIIDHLLDS